MGNIFIPRLYRFVIFPIALKPGKIHILGDVLSKTPHVEGESILSDV